MASRFLRRLRRRAKRVLPTWRIVLYDGVGGCEVVRTYRPTRKARAMLRSAFIRFEIEQVA